MITILENRSESPELDIWLILSVFILVGVSVSMIYSASLMRSMSLYKDRYFVLRSQVLWVLLGMIILIITSNIDYRVYKKWSKPILLVVLFLMIVSFVPTLSHKVGKARRWIKIGFFQMQPSEFVKLALVFYLSDLLSRKEKEIEDFKYAFLPALIMVMLFALLILLQNDLGTALIVLIISFSLIYVSGVRPTHILLVGLASLPFIGLTIVRESYRMKRIFGYLNPWEYRTTIGYNIIQALRSFHNGGFFGLGLGHGTQKIRNLPAPYTDFIFAVCGEEAGLLGVIIIIGLFLIIMIRGFSIALAAKDGFSRLLATGLTLMILVQAVVNMEVVTGLLPPTGLTLPFISYGGTSLITNMFAIGVLLNIHRFNVENRSLP